MHAAALARAARCALLVGTTRLSEAAPPVLRETASVCPVLLAPNTTTLVDVILNRAQTDRLLSIGAGQLTVAPDAASASMAGSSPCVRNTRPATGPRRSTQRSRSAASAWPE